MEIFSIAEAAKIRITLVAYMDCGHEPNLADSTIPAIPTPLLQRLGLWVHRIPGYVICGG